MGERLPIPCRHDECTFHSNNEVHHGCVHKNKHLMRKMSKGQGLMVSDVILHCHWLEMLLRVLLA